MPWLPEFFSAPVLEGLKEKWGQDELVVVPYFDGLLAGEPAALIKSFAGEPEVHDPVRGRVKGTRAFEAFVIRTNAWLTELDGTVEDVGFVVTGGPVAGEVILHLDGAAGRVELPLAAVADREARGRITEVRIYAGNRPLTGRHANRPPLLQPDPALHLPGVVAEYQRALASGDVDAIVATFEPDGYARGPAGELHRGADGLRAFYAHLFSNGGGIPLEHCAVVDDGRACVLEYNVVSWGRTELPPAAGLVVFVRGPSGRLAAARMYDDVDPPLG